MIECGALGNLRAAINEVTALLRSFSAQMTKNQIAFETAVKALHLKLLGMQGNNCPGEAIARQLLMPLHFIFQDDVQLRAHINEVTEPKRFPVWL
jgi:hypothetical protein